MGSWGHYERPPKRQHPNEVGVHRTKHSSTNYDLDRNYPPPINKKPRIDPVSVRGPVLVKQWLIYTTSTSREMDGGSNPTIILGVITHRSTSAVLRLRASRMSLINLKTLVHLIPIVMLQLLHLPRRDITRASRPSRKQLNHKVCLALHILLQHYWSRPLEHRHSIKTSCPAPQHSYKQHLTYTRIKRAPPRL
jgi:hypothetical protein